MSEQEASAGVSTTDNKKEAESAQVSAEAKTDKANSEEEDKTKPESEDLDAKQDEEPVLTDKVCLSQRMPHFVSLVSTGTICSP